MPNNHVTELRTQLGMNSIPELAVRQNRIAQNQA
jgi:hypothetical protein